MKLIDLDAQFVRYEVRRERKRFVKPDVVAARPHGPFTDDDIEEREADCIYLVDVDTLAEADGISFLCPKCWREDPAGPIGTHTVVCWFEGKVADDVQPGPGRWNPVGTSYHDLSFVPGKRSHSVLLLGGCKAHFFVTNGDVS